MLQVNEDLLQILNTDEATNGFSVTSAPVILYLGSAHCDISSSELAEADADDKQLKRVSAVLFMAADVIICQYSCQFLVRIVILVFELQLDVIFSVIFRLVSRNDFFDF